MNSLNTALALDHQVNEQGVVTTLTQSGRTTRALLSPQQLRKQLPLSAQLAQRVQQQREHIRAIINGEDHRLLVVIGPCSIHNIEEAIEYAERLAVLSEQVSDQILLAMRVYIEKPRTTVGWKGLLYDPHLDGSADMAKGLQLSRQLMLHTLELNLPVTTELLQPLTASYFDDLLSWAAIGARTSESQIHREMVSGLQLPVGFKNGTDGSVGIALDAMRSAAHTHQHFGLDMDGRAALVETRGNPDTHLVLRGGHQGPNYDAQSIAQACSAMREAGLEASLMVDCSHANSGKNPQLQPQVLQSVLQQRVAGERSLRAVMLESNLMDGQQALCDNLQYGVSITDGCLGWNKTEHMLLNAAQTLREKA
ncbi:MAG TPA: 3-deoxy-7-phosphoheptulonate synthase [Thiopseudomonas sp.]|nr:3-deoxy-7-phosphoheptulonate synthase [Thiopseudomonas sp.]